MSRLQTDNVYFANFAFKAAREETDDNGDERRVIYGIASTGVVDRQGTIVDQKSLFKAARKYLKRKGKLFYNHNWTVPVGRALEVHPDEENEKLYVKGLVGKGFPVPVRDNAFSAPVMLNVDDIWQMVKQDLVSSYSIGFQANEKQGERKSDGSMGPSTLEVTDLLEVSLVPIAANPEAEFAVTKASDNPFFASVFRRELSRAEIWKLDEDAGSPALGYGKESEEDDADLALVKGELEQWLNSMRC